ncbi:MAG: type II secretion system protein [SAR202 cluster bacterium]|nr:type II secretion system protein [SAR202 cluster bacterium]|tara:strand:- start:25216 stop:25914 length:699 start_codon:yes stop_codon:yes gene_type:complete
MKTYSIKKQIKKSRGFTLIELIVVIAIMGVLTSIVTPSLIRHFGQSQEEAYRQEVAKIQSVVDQYLVSENNPRWHGEMQFPIIGATKISTQFYEGDQNSQPNVLSDGINSNPFYGGSGGFPKWLDNGDNKRDQSVENILNDEDSDPNQFGWHVSKITYLSNTYYVDSRDYFINFDLLSDMFRNYPKSAAQENCPTSTCTGSYIYFIDKNGTVQTLLAELPIESKTGFQNIFP